MLKKGTIVDSTIIDAPSSTKNREKQRDPETKSTKKGNTWHFGYKAHIGVDQDTGLTHYLEVTAINEHDVTVTEKLLHGEEECIRGDGRYIGADKRQNAIKRNKNGKKINYKINPRPSTLGEQTKLYGIKSPNQTKRTRKIRHPLQSRANLYLADKRFCLAV